jgi:PHP family Zn ribbon phosphoesterase
MEPSDSIKNRNMCPKCGRKLTIGVLHRVEELADRPEGAKPDNAIPFKSLIPLSEIISNMLGINQLYSKKVWEQHTKLIKAFGSELNVLLDASMEKLSGEVGEGLAGAIVGVREGRIRINPGYDGVYGYPVFDGKAKKPGVGSTVQRKPLAPPVTKPLDRQKSISDFGARENA